LTTEIYCVTIVNIHICSDFLAKANNVVFLFYYFVLSVEGNAMVSTPDESVLREQYRAYMAAAPTGMLVFSDDGYIREANPAAARMTGFDVNVLSSMHMAHLLLPSDADILCSKHFSSDNPLVSEVRLQGRHGQLSWTRMHITTVSSGMYIAFFEEITQQKFAEEKLRASEERFRHIAEAAGEYIWETDALLRLTFASAKLGEMLKRPIKELLGTTPFAFLPSEDAARIQMALMEASQTGKPIPQIEHRFKLEDGTTYWLEVRACAFFDSKGNLAGYRGVSVDVSARKEAEEAQRATQQQLQTILDNMPIGMFEITSDGRVQYINPHLAALFGYAAQQELLKVIEEHHYIEEAVYAYPSKPVRLLLEEQQQSGDICRTYENDFRRKDGSVFTGRVVMAQKPDPVSGQMMRFGFIEDISGSTDTAVK